MSHPDTLLYGVDLFGDPMTPPCSNALSERFGMCPFSVLNAQDGAWIARKQAWNDLGLRGDEGRDAPAFGIHEWAEEHKAGCPTGSGTSVFDPVLCEVVYRWFSRPGFAVLDPFAGEATKGLVAEMLGRRYTGVELRPEQITVNQAQAQALRVSPTWILGDSADVFGHSVGDAGPSFDLLFTSPPYFNLEQYGGGSDDGSELKTYPAFMTWYRGIFAGAVARLRNHRFVVVKVGEVRDRRTGGYHNFVGDNIDLFTGLGLLYWNEIIFITRLGTLPVRVTKQFNNSRKIGKTHQNLLVFYKGDPRRIRSDFGDVT